MIEFTLSFLILVLSIAAMAIGRLFGRRGISCCLHAAECGEDLPGCSGCSSREDPAANQSSRVGIELL